jgi:hypothetical protein
MVFCLYLLRSSFEPQSRVPRSARRSTKPCYSSLSLRDTRCASFPSRLQNRRFPPMIGNARPDAMLSSCSFTESIYAGITEQAVC